jgi:hypothetical protein
MSPSRSYLGRRILLFVALGGLAGVSGCGGDAKLAPVSGRVTMPGGKVLTTGTVIFHPDKDKGNTFGGECVGDINASGEYTLQTRGKPGAPLGAYKVTVSAGADPITSDNTKPSTASLVNTTYSNADTTTITKEVVDKPAAGAYDIAVGP